MIQQIQMAYMDRRWVKSVAFCVLVACGALLYWLAGGFPPWAWRFLVATLPLLPQLWAAHGPAILSPLAGLVLISLALLIMWVSLTVAIVKVGMHWWQDFHSQQRFAADLQEAEALAEAFTSPENAQLQDIYSWQEEQEEQEQEKLTASVPARRNVYTTGRREDVEQAASVPLRAASPAYPRLVPSQRLAAAQTNRAPAVSLRNQLRIVPPTQQREESTYKVQSYQPAIDIDQYNTVPPHTDTLKGGEGRRTRGPAEERISSDLKHTDYLTEELRSEDVLSDNVQPGETRLRLSVGVGLDPGIVRKDAPNEDTLLAVQGTRITEHGPEPVGLFVVADGMGGHANGQEASRIAIQTMSDVIVPIIMRGADENDNFLELLREGAHRANLALYQRNRKQPRMMGTTLTAALVAAETAYIVNVGDSRTYIYRKGKDLSPVTRDHSIVARMVESGAITRDEIYTHPKRNQIYRCLGDHSTVDVDTYVEKLHYDDVLMLCSDGLWEMVRDRDIQSIIETSAAYPSQTSSMLVQAALSRGGADNVSVVVVHMARAESAH